MKAQNRKAAPDAPEPAAPDKLERTPDVMTLALQEFSAELAARFPDRMIKRFVMPSTVRECREIFLLELTSRDEIEAAQMADATMSGLEKASVRLTNDAERREAIRLAIIGLGKPGDDKRIAYEHAGAEGAPFYELNTWSAKAWTTLHAYFGQLNGVPMDEIAEGIQGARIVGAFAPPTSAILASAAGGK